MVVGIGSCVSCCGDIWRGVCYGWELNVIWMGHPVVSTRDKYFPAQVWLSDYEIGLRDDGVVVWRKTPKQQGEESQK